jgi:GNAT superfamily N-acetyltransferase
MPGRELGTVGHVAGETGQVLARAFHDDPMFTFIQPDAERRERSLPWFFTAAARLGRRQGRLDEEPGQAAAIWLGPGHTDLGAAAILRSGLWAAPARLGPAAFRRFIKLTTAFEEAGARAHGDTFWHLFILGVDPRLQGRGRGGELIAPVLDRADGAGHECYLETCAQSNLAFYTRHRFEVVERVDRAGLPTFWTMIRRPR